LATTVNELRTDVEGTTFEIIVSVARRGRISSRNDQKYGRARSLHEKRQRSDNRYTDLHLSPPIDSSFIER
jgi:hypothetical protein